MTGPIFRGLDMADDVLHSNHRHRSIHAADDAPKELLSAPLVAAYDLQGRRLQLITLLGEPLHDLQPWGWAAPTGLMRYMQHRKEYKNVPTDKCG